MVSEPWIWVSRPLVPRRVLWLVARSKHWVRQSSIQYRASLLNLVGTKNCEYTVTDNLGDVQEHGEARQVVLGHQLATEPVVRENAFADYVASEY